MAYNFYNPQGFMGQTQPMFPQPNGNVYLISSSLEVANVPAGAGVTAALCTQENLLYLKTVQNGVPTFLAYKLSPYTESPKPTQEENPVEVRIAALEKQIQTIVTLISGGKRNDELQSNAPATATTSEWN